MEDFKNKINDTIEEFYHNSENDKGYKLLFEFINSDYNYETRQMEIDHSPKKAEKPKVVNFKKLRNKGSKLF